MIAFSSQYNEARIAALKSYAVLDTPEEEAYNDLVRLAAQICDAPIAALSLVDEHRQWFKAEVGLGIKETPSAESICQQCLDVPAYLEIADIRFNPRSSGVPLPKGAESLRFYARERLDTPEGYPIGTLVIMDTTIRTLSDLQRESLRVLAAQVMMQLELRRKTRELEQQTQDALDSGKLLQLIADNLPARICYLDQKFRYRFANQLYKSELALEPSEILGKSVRQVVGEVAYPIIEPILERAIRGQTTEFEEYFPYPNRARWVHGKFVPDVLENGEVVGIIAHLADVTRRRKAEQALAESKAFLDRTLEKANIATYSWDIVNDRLTGNPLLNRIYGLPDNVSSVSREEYFAAIHPEDRDAAKQRSQDLLGRGESYEAQYRVIDRAGKTRWVLARGDIELDESGRPVRLSGVVIDITDRIAAARQLEEAKQLLESSLLLAKVGTWHWDRATRAVSCDKAVQQIFRFTDAEAACCYSADYEKRIHPDDRKTIDTLFAQLLVVGVPYEIEYRVVHEDQTLWVLERGFAEFDDLGYIVGVRGVILDNTLQKTLAERDIARLTALLELAPALTVVIEGPEFRLTHMNRAARLFAKRPNVLGKPILEAFPEFIEQGLETVLREVVRTGEPQYRTAMPVRFGAEGETAAREQYVDLVYIALRNQRDEVYGVFIHGSDVTDAVTTQRSLLESTQLFQRVFEEASDDGIVITDSAGIVVAWNPAAERIAGYRADETIGQSSEIFFTRKGVDAAGLSEILAEAQQFGKALLERWHVRKDGSRFWGSGTITCIRDAQNVITGYLMVFRDASERYQADLEVRRLNEQLETKVAERTEKLEEAVREAEAFNYAMSHDLRSPLRAISGTAAILIEEAAGYLAPDHLDLLKRQERSAKRLGELTDELLRLSRLTHVQLRRESIDITELVRSVLRDMNLPNRVEVAESMSAHADAQLLRTVFDNLLSNAAKFSPPGSEIVVSLSDGVFCVRDQGIGFEMEHARRLFLPFERLVTEEEFPGTGIGLANVERIVRRHGGRIWAESYPRQGAAFFFTLG